MYLNLSKRYIIWNEGSIRLRWKEFKFPLSTIDYALLHEDKVNSEYKGTHEFEWRAGEPMWTWLEYTERGSASKRARRLRRRGVTLTYSSRTRQPSPFAKPTPTVSRNSRMLRSEPAREHFSKQGFSKGLLYLDPISRDFFLTLSH